MGGKQAGSPKKGWMHKPFGGRERFEEQPGTLRQEGLMNGYIKKGSGVMDSPDLLLI